MYFLKIADLFFSVKNEIKSFHPTPTGSRLYVRDTHMDFPAGEITTALNWFFSLDREPVHVDGTPFFTFDLLEGYAHKEEIEAVQFAIREPRTVVQNASPQVPSNIADMIASLQGQVAQLQAAGQTPLGPIKSPGLTLVPQPQPLIRYPKLNSARIKEAVEQKGKGPAQFFPGETPETQSPSST